VEQFFGLYGFVDVLLRTSNLIAQSAAGGGAAFLVFIAAPLAREARGAEGARLLALARRWVLAAASAALAAALAGAALQAVVLAATLRASIGVALGAGFVLVAAGVALAALAIVALAAPRAPPGPWRCAAFCAAALALATAAIGDSHAVARTDGRVPLFAATLLHQAGAALWLGGLPPFLQALSLPPALARRVGRLYSRQAAVGVALIGVGILGFWGGYLGGAKALYGTAYGAMSATKGTMLAVLLALGACNFALLHGFAGGAGAGAALERVRRFVECEIAIGVSVLAVAASLTSLPPAVDLPDDYASWSEVAERFTPRPPRLSSPDHADLAISALQAGLDEGWRRTQAEARPRAYTPGEGVPPPRNAQDVAWSEYNHNWAGVAVLLVGFAALLDAGRRVRMARHWPLLFLGLAAFILVRADPEAWPLGDIGLLESLRDSGTVQHKLSGLLVVAFALSEWGVRLGRLGGRARFVFPVAMLAGGLLLLMHSHSFANAKEGLLVELSHLPIGVLAVLAGCSRWLELRGPEALSRPARWVWPICLVLVGIMLAVYREA
jgi:copper resistance protein D